MNNSPLSTSSLWLSYITSSSITENSNNNSDIIEKNENFKKMKKSFKNNDWIKVESYGVLKK